MSFKGEAVFYHVPFHYPFHTSILLYFQIPHLNICMDQTLHPPTMNCLYTKSGVATPSSLLCQQAYGKRVAMKIGPQCAQAEGCQELNLWCLQACSLGHHWYWCEGEGRLMLSIKWFLYFLPYYGSSLFSYTISMFQSFNLFQLPLSPSIS